MVALGGSVSFVKTKQCIERQETRLFSIHPLHRPNLKKEQRSISGVNYGYFKGLTWNSGRSVRQDRRMSVNHRLAHINPALTAESRIEQTWQRTGSQIHWRMFLTLIWLCIFSNPRDSIHRGSNIERRSIEDHPLNMRLIAINVHILHACNG
jgi:hypothetical protein